MKRLIYFGFLVLPMLAQAESDPWATYQSEMAPFQADSVLIGVALKCGLRNESWSASANAAITIAATDAAMKLWPKGNNDTTAQGDNFFMTVGDQFSADQSFGMLADQTECAQAAATDPFAQIDKMIKWDWGTGNAN